MLQRTLACSLLALAACSGGNFDVAEMAPEPDASDDGAQLDTAQLDTAADPDSGLPPSDTGKGPDTASAPDTGLPPPNDTGATMDTAEGPDTATGPDTSLPPPSDTGAALDTATDPDTADAYVPPPVVTKVTWDNVCTSKTTTFTIYGSNLSFGVVAKLVGCKQAGGIQTYAHTGGNTATRTFYCDPFGGTAGFTEGVTIYWQVGTTYTPLYSTNVNYQLC